MILYSLIGINRYSYPISAYLNKRKGHKEPKNADASNVPHSAARCGHILVTLFGVGDKGNKYKCLEEYCQS